MELFNHIAQFVYVFQKSTGKYAWNFQNLFFYVKVDWFFSNSAHFNKTI